MSESVKDDTARRVLMTLIGILESNKTISQKDYTTLKSELGYEPM
jgi:hypothetical protein